MGKLEKILEIVSLIFGVFYYICEYATKTKAEGISVEEVSETTPETVDENQQQLSED